MLQGCATRIGSQSDLTARPTLKIARDGTLAAKDSMVIMTIMVV